MWKAYETTLDHIWWLVTVASSHTCLRRFSAWEEQLPLSSKAAYVRKARVLGYAKHFIQKERSRLILFSSLIKIHLF